MNLFLPNEAITICNVNQAQKSAVALLREHEEHAILQNICRHPVSENESMAGNWDAYKDVLLKVSQPCDTMIVSCEYGHINTNCTKIFSSILTDGGLCCIFNGLHKKFIMNLEYDDVQF